LRMRIICSVDVLYIGAVAQWAFVIPTHGDWHKNISLVVFGDESNASVDCIGRSDWLRLGLFNLTSWKARTKLYLANGWGIRRYEKPPGNKTRRFWSHSYSAELSRTAMILL